MGSTHDMCSSFNSSRVSLPRQTIRFVSMESRDGAWCWDKTRIVLEAQMYSSGSQLEAHFKEGVATRMTLVMLLRSFVVRGWSPQRSHKRNSCTHGEVPFKFMSRDCLVALEGYTRVFRAGKVDEPPTYLTKVILNEKDVLNHFMNDSTHPRIQAGRRHSPSRRWWMG